MSNAKPIGPAYARTVCCALAVAAVVLLVVFAVTVRNLLLRRGATAAVQQARLCAAALEPGPSGDLTRSYDELRARYGGLQGIATLTPTGTLQHVYAEGPAHRAALEDAVKARASPATVSTSAKGQRYRFWAVTTSLNGVDSPTAWKAVFLLRQESGSRSLLMATAGFAVFLALTLGITYWTLTHWFNRSVVCPLQRLARSVGRLSHLDDESLTRCTGGWQEVQTLANAMRQVAEQAKNSERRARRSETVAGQQIDKHERHVGHRLRRAEDRATSDPLTGLHNRRLLDKKLEPLFEEHQSRQEDLAFLMADVDNFKELNDGRGHSAGDDVLRFLGSLLEATIRPTDYAVRWGGDEFLLILPGVNARQAAKIAGRIIKLFGQHVSALDTDAPLSLSVGVATLKTSACTNGMELIEQADQALYDAKRSGKSAVAGGRVA